MSDILDLFESVRNGELDPKQAVELFLRSRIADLGFARVDLERETRCGFPEVVMGTGKTPSEVVAISRAILDRSSRLLVTRVDPPQAQALAEAFEDAVFHERPRLVTVRRNSIPDPEGKILIVTGGTADLPVAEEARVTCTMMDARVETLYDVGVAGLHRLAREVERLRLARVLVVVAGMEGALPSVIAGLIDRPIVAVPTSMGYGAHFSGLAPLLAMLNSCAAGVVVVNVDNGFGAGYAASLINRSPS